MQILSRHAIGVIGSYEASPEFTYAGQWLHNTGDGSGIVAPALTYTFNHAVSLLGTVYVPYGQPPDGAAQRIWNRAVIRAVAVAPLLLTMAQEG